MDPIYHKIYLTFLINKSKKTIGYDGLRFLLENFHEENASTFINYWEPKDVEGEIVMEIVEMVNNKIPFEMGNNGKLELINELKFIIGDLIQNGNCIKTFKLEYFNLDQLNVLNQVLSEINLKIENPNNKKNQWIYHL